MKRRLWFAAIALVALLLAACDTDTNTDATPTPAPEMGMGGEMGMDGEMGPPPGMGPESGMRERHQATIPPEYADKESPVAATEASLARGEASYTTYCETCHGAGGMGDGPGGENLDPQPAPIAHTSQMLGDAYLFWRISEGGSMDPFNSAMPAWKGALEEEARWDVINYIRSLG